MRSRRASHAGSWYDSSSSTLAASLSSWLADAGAAGVQQKPSLAGIIAPHAGYSYSGPAAGHAYAAIDPSAYHTVFVLGPSHHVQVSRQACLTRCELLDTPLGGLAVDRGISAELLKERGPSGRALFVEMDTIVDEDEHSIEMHLPYVRQVFGKDADVDGRVRVVPVMVGALDAASGRALGAVFARWLGQPGVLFIVSTDFCHWGRRFGYEFVDGGGGEIWESIERLDRRGMAAVESGGHDGFARYIAETQNTVCGRYPIAVVLAAIESSGHELFGIEFVHYEQSSKCQRKADSSVSYASAHISLKSESETGRAT
jgi:MEMO1 family protein